MNQREDIRKLNPKNENSFYDVFEKREAKDKRRYNILAGITKVSFGRTK